MNQDKFSLVGATEVFDEEIRLLDSLDIDEHTPIEVQEAWSWVTEDDILIDSYTYRNKTFP